MVIEWTRLLVTWLNDAALEFGGRLIAPPNVGYVASHPLRIVTDFRSVHRTRQAFSYFAAHGYPSSPIWIADIIEEDENTPRAEWDAYNGTYPHRKSARTANGPCDVWDKLSPNWVRRELEHWADFSHRW